MIKYENWASECWKWRDDKLKSVFPSVNHRKSKIEISCQRQDFGAFVEWFRKKLGDSAYSEFQKNIDYSVLCNAHNNSVESRKCDESKREISFSVNNNDDNLLTGKFISILIVKLQVSFVRSDFSLYSLADVKREDDPEMHELSSLKFEISSVNEKRSYQKKWREAVSRVIMWFVVGRKNFQPFFRLIQIFTLWLLSTVQEDRTRLSTRSIYATSENKISKKI